MKERSGGEVKEIKGRTSTRGERITEEPSAKEERECRRDDCSDVRGEGTELVDWWGKDLS